MSTITLNATDFANLVRGADCVIMPVAIGGYLYMVIRGGQDANLYRTAIA